MWPAALLCGFGRERNPERQFGIAVTKQDLDDERRSLKLPQDLEMAQFRDQSATILSALSAVY